MVQINHYTLSDVVTPDNKGYRRKTWSHGWKCTVSHRATPYDFGLGNQKMFLFDHLYYLFSTISFSVLCIEKKCQQAAILNLHFFINQ